MMKEKDRKKMSIKEKFNSKRKCVIVKSRMSPKERKFKRKKKTNLTIFLLKKLNRKFPSKNNKWEIENQKNSKDSNKLWNKMKKTKEDFDNKPKDKDLR